MQWSDRVGQTKVTIFKDGQFATLTFNQALMTQPIAASPPQPPPQPQLPQTTIPGQPPQPIAVPSGSMLEIP